MSSARTNITLSLLWAFGLGSLGFFLPFYALYLTENAGLSGTEAGMVVALLPLVGIVMQPIWGQIADRTGRRNRVVAVLSFGVALMYAVLSLQRDFVGYAITTALLAIFATSFGSMSISATIAALEETGSHRLGRVRVWGTIVYGLVVAALPLAVRRAEAEGWFINGGGAEVGAPALGLMFVGGSLFAAIAGFAALAVPRTRSTRARAERGEWRVLFADRRFRGALVFAFLSHLSMQGPMHMFPLLVRGHGGGIEAISLMWVWMIALEVPLVFVLGRTVDHFSERGIVAIGIGSSAIRWTLSGFVEDMQLLTAIQILHGVTVWGLMMGMPLYIDSLVPDRLRSTGQAALGIFGVGFGAVASTFLAGWLVDKGGGQAPAQAGGALAAICLLLVPLLLPKSAPLAADPQRSDRA